MYAYGLSRRALFERVDQSELKPLPKHPFVFATWKTAKVNLDYHIEVARHYYSVPYWFVGRQVNVKVSEQLVEVFFENQRISVHPRSTAEYRHSTLATHMPPEHWEYKRQSKAMFLGWAHHIGPQTQAQVATIFASKPHEEQAFRSLKGIQGLATRYGHERLEDACHRANVLGMSGYQRLKHILQHHRDKTPVLVDVPVQASLHHENVRGEAYYN